VASEVKRGTVLGNRAYDLVRGAIWDQCSNLKSHGDLGPNLADEVRNHLIGDPAGIAPDACGIESYRAMEPTWLLRGDLTRDRTG
jgi:hypothetical protein